jgi:hypothetical protein
MVDVGARVRRRRARNGIQEAAGEVAHHTCVATVRVRYVPGFVSGQRRESTKDVAQEIVVCGPFQPREPVNPPTRKDWIMVNPYNGLLAQPDGRPWGAEAASRAIQRADRARRQAEAAQRAAAASLDGSAASHERTARAYQAAAEHRERRDDESLEHAAWHREFAEEDRRMAERLRRMADINSIDDVAMPWDRR